MYPVARTACSHASGILCVGAVDMSAIDTFIDFAIEVFPSDGSGLVLTYDSSYVIAAYSSGGGHTGDDISHVSSTDTCCRSVLASHHRSCGCTSLDISTVVGATDTSCMVVVDIAFGDVHVHLRRAVEDKGLQRSFVALPPVDLSNGVATDMSHDTSHVEGSSEVDGHIRLTAIDADRVVGIAHQSAYPRSVFTEVVRGGAIGHSTCDFRPTDVTAVDGSIEILFARHTQSCAEQSGSNTLRVGGAVIDREYHLCVGDIEVAHISLAVPKESIAVAASTTFYSYLHLVDGFTIAVEITLKGIVLVDTDGYPVSTTCKVYVIL